ncbi:uncharacterized protein LOC107271002 [Cephus cinctus]|uniref:Uncharacterized protein LOC107271002 n=1 Tax=Cephus cinctus TaxID=211228 RepID=A0AAJ7C551_CEPCN|nr:uncharacterized protein LOC107271002 [Cephus cinctus]
MYDICHPSFYEMGQLGCNDHNKIITAFHVYIELCEVKRLWDVKYQYNKDIDLIYLEAKTSRSSPHQIYIPWSTANPISLKFIEQMQQKLDTNRLTLVFKDGDSSSIYYKVSEGLVKPLTPEDSKQQKCVEEKRLKLEREIQKNTSNLYELAKTIDNENTQGSNHEVEILETSQPS